MTISTDDIDPKSYSVPNVGDLRRVKFADGIAFMAYFEERENDGTFTSVGVELRLACDRGNIAFTLRRAAEKLDNWDCTTAAMRLPPDAATDLVGILNELFEQIDSRQSTISPDPDLIETEPYIDTIVYKGSGVGDLRLADYTGGRAFLTYSYERQQDGSAPLVTADLVATVQDDCVFITMHRRVSRPEGMDRVKIELRLTPDAVVDLVKSINALVEQAKNGRGMP